MSARIAMIEGLENRQLFALIVPGTAGPDTIVVSDVAGPTTHIWVNGVLGVFADAAIDEVHINAGSGNDKVSVMANFKKTAVIRGGLGDDVLSGGSGNDKILGEYGNDRLYGNAGSDFLDGWAGNDYLNGGTGRDEMHCRWGFDTCVNNLDGARDVIFRNPAQDIVVGGLDPFDVLMFEW